MSNAPDDLSWREGRSPFRAIGLLLALYFLTRVGSLSVLPVFLDESVHIQWAERLFGEGRILRPVGSGRLLAVVAYGLALPFDDRLWVARLVAVLVGAMALLFTMVLSRRLFGSRAGAIAGALYVLSPFALTYDRLALSDGFLSAAIAGLMVAIQMLIRRPNSTRARAAVAVSIMLAVLSKVSALLFVVTVPLAVLTLAHDRRKTLKGVAIAGAIGLVGASPMLWFFASNSGEIASQHLVDPLVGGSHLASTLGDMREWVLSYFTAPVLMLAVATVLLLRDGRALWLGGSVVLPFVFFALFSQPWSARYVLPTLPPLLILLSGGIDTLAQRVKPSLGAMAAGLLTLLVSFPGIAFDRYLLFEPALAPFPSDDRLQLVTGWPSGYGVRELAARLRDEAKGSPLTAYLDTGGTRTVPTSLAILLGGNPAIRLVEGDFGSAELRAAMVSESKSRSVFAVRGPRPTEIDFVFAGASVERVELFQRPGGEWAATLFRLRASEQMAPNLF